MRKTKSPRPMVSTAVSSPSPPHHLPGGPVPVTAVPYVGRSYDGYILNPEAIRSTAILIRGPVQVGKSTALALLQRAALDNEIETAWFDPRLPPTDNSRDSDADSTLALSELLQANWGLRRPARAMIDTIPKLIHWLLGELAPTASKPRLLILDDLVALGGGAAERWLAGFVRLMVNQRASHHVNINIAVGLTEHFNVSSELKELAISSVNWQPSVSIGWFDMESVAKLWQELRAVQATEVEENGLVELYAMFKGQPYLTHAGLIDRAFRYVVREWINDRAITTAKAIRQSPWYDRHLTAIRLEILGPALAPDSEVRRLTRSFFELCWTASPVSDHNHELFLKSAKLLDGLGNPALDIYRLVAEDLAAEYIR